MMMLVLRIEKQQVWVVDDSHCHTCLLTPKFEHGTVTNCQFELLLGSHGKR